MKSKFLGEFEMVVLGAVLKLGDGAYGAAIRQEIEQGSERSVSIGALYTTLTRLETKGYVGSRLGESTPQRGGRAKRYFRVTDAGEAQLRRSFAALNRMLEGVL
ncbi:MAG: helix-turn-helix transcriptional regulator [Pseudomonadota bacterium]